MPASYALVKLMHLLLFVYWLGGDIGVFYSARFVRDRSLSPDARRTALRIMTWVDMLPRYCLVLMVPVGYTLATEIGAVRISTAALAGVWLVGLLWLANVATIHYAADTPVGERLRKIDLLWRVLVIGGFLWDSGRGFAGSGHVLAGWLAAKLAIFAALVFCGLMIRLLGAPLRPALQAVLASGSAPELEATIARTAARTRPFVLAIWVGLVLAAYIGIAKPAFG